MVKLNKIYTKTGDNGTTALGDGTRRKKNDLRIIAYGTVDEVNAAIGLALAFLENNKIDKILAKIQNDLFDIGADLCVAGTSKKNKQGKSILRLQNSQVKWLEKNIDKLNSELQPLTSFVLCGGTKAAASLHLARTITRRAERAIFALAESEPINKTCLIYMNRLSDFLFVAARFANNKGKEDILWIPGKNRAKIEKNKK